MEGTNKKLFKTKENLVLIGEEKVENPEELMFRPWPFPIVIWSGPSKEVTWWIFCDILVTWWEALESGYQLREGTIEELVRKTWGLVCCWETWWLVCRGGWV